MVVAGVRYVSVAVAGVRCVIVVMAYVCDVSV